jgi:hypothetical protein
MGSHESPEHAETWGAAMKPPAAPNPWKTGAIRDLQKKRIEAREAKALAATLAARVAELECKLRSHGIEP